jgi:hypothetical protein
MISQVVAGLREKVGLGDLSLKGYWQVVNELADVLHTLSGRFDSAKFKQVCLTPGSKATDENLLKELVELKCREEALKKELDSRGCLPHEKFDEPAQVQEMVQKFDALAEEMMEDARQNKW